MINRRPVIAAGLAIALIAAGAADARKLPAPAAAPASTANSEVAVLSGGCFWGVQGVFLHVKGVTQAVSGYAGGTTVNPSYEQVSTETTGHAETVKITFDPKQISYGQILQVFFSVATNPTQLNRQGPDTGTSYRNEIFYTSPQQKQIAEAYIAQLTAAHVYNAPIVTRVDPLKAFYPAEAYHQDYLLLHPDSGYIMANDLPKVADLKASFPELWRDPPLRQRALEG